MKRVADLIKEAREIGKQAHKTHDENLSYESDIIRLEAEFGLWWLDNKQPKSSLWKYQANKYVEDKNNNGHVDYKRMEWIVDISDINKLFDSPNAN